MNRRNDKTQRPQTPKPMRGKYARAFEKGVKVVIHDDRTRDRRFVVRRNANGEFVWTPQTAIAKRQRKAS
ncbi:MAG: hypothetical protein L0Y44_08155 [Phycisphaerales bacterium]|nr:hypothetical protein [Phycisphaerales bacterium]MCI0630608.1 hypothetical protein [Phycisphaerales bacterium]MCI0676833.1 hypothetical protein [Phycisphaerales bacterium]